MRSNKTYFLYEGWSEEPKVHWQNGGTPTVPGCRRGKHEWYPPDPRWLVTGYSARQACAFVHASETTSWRGDGLGIWWDRNEHDLPVPYGADQTVYYAAEALCRAPTLTLWSTREAAEETVDQQCGGGCCGNHRIIALRLAEVRKCKSRWAWCVGGDRDV